MSDFITVTTNDISGRKITKVIGEVAGLTVYSPGTARGIVGGFSSMFKGEVTQFTTSLKEAREQALERLIDEAKEKGANSLLAVRFDSNTFGNGLMEIYAYGTAAIIE